MSKFLLLAYCMFKLNLCYSYSNSTNDTIRSNIKVIFNKVQYSGDAFNTSDLKIDFVPANNQVLLYFRLPNFTPRYKTTLNDYLALQTENDKKIFYNLKENPASEGSISLNAVLSRNYYFVFSVDKNFLITFLKNTKRNFTFCFSANADYITSQLATDKFMCKKLKNLFRKTAKMDEMYIVSKPDETQIRGLVVWLENLKK